MLNARQIEIIKQLFINTLPLDMKELIKIFNKSERTIRYDIQVVREFLGKKGVRVELKNKIGFYIPIKYKYHYSKISEELEQIKKTHNSLGEDNEKIPLCLLYFLAQNKPVNMDHIVSSLYMSRSSIFRLFQKFKLVYQDKMSIQLISTDGYEIVGEEKEIRHQAALILVNLLKGSYSVDNWYHFLPEYFKSVVSFDTLENIVKGLKKANATYGIWMSNNSFIYLLSYCLVGYVRNKNNQHEVMIDSNNKNYVIDLLNSIKVNAYDTEEVKLLENVLSVQSINHMTDGVVGVPIQTAIDKIIKFLMSNSDKYKLKLDYALLRLDLEDHINGYINKKEKDFYIDENPLLKEIKDKYNFYYDIAIQCVKIFKEVTNIELSESEISYIAIYLYKNRIEGSRLNNRVLIVCATGKGSSNLLVTRIRNVFHNLEIVGHVSPFQIDESAYSNDIDFVISTIPLPESSLPVINISVILNKEDIQRILDFIHYGKNLDAIPFNQEHTASFNSKTELQNVKVDNFDIQKETLTNVSQVISNLIISLIDTTSKFPKEYQMSQEALLGMIIHLSLAVPRWFDEEPLTNTHGVEELYCEIEKKHKVIFVLMKKYFMSIEESLLIDLEVSEKYAFFLYIINELNKR